MMWNVCRLVFYMVQRNSQPVASRTRSRTARPPLVDDAARLTLIDDVGPTTSLLTSIVNSLQVQQQLLLNLTQQQLRSLNPQHASREHQRGSGVSSIIRRLDVPKLDSPKSVDISGFQDWQVRWKDFLEMTQVEDNLPDTASQDAFLRSALDKDWASLWVSGRLNILDSDYLHAAVRKIGSYLRRKRNPLVDRQSFHGRDEANGESIDQYFSALSRIHNACDFEDEHGCTSCGQACSHGVVIANTRLRDRLICGLFDKGMQRRVLEEQYDTSLSLERVLQVCSAYESSKNTESTLGEVGDAPTNDIAAVRSNYRCSRRQSAAPVAESATNAGTTHCQYCGSGQHPRAACKAWGKRCNKCNKIGHFAKFCRQRTDQLAAGDTLAPTLYTAAFNTIQFGWHD